MKLIKLLAAALLSLMLNIPTSYASDDDHRHQVETLFKLTQMEQKVNDSIDSIMQLQMSQNPQLLQHKAAIRAFFERQIGWAALKGYITDMYLQAFTEDELKAINDFYITPTGQKVINTLPDLVQQRNQLAMQRIQQNIGELQQILAPASAP